MALENVKVRVCDKCGGEGGVDRYVITYPDGRRSVDLCVPDATKLSLVAIKDLIGTPRRGRVVKGQAVVSEATVKRARKTPTKK